MVKLTLLLLAGISLLAQNPNTAAFPAAVATDSTLLVANDNASGFLAATIDQTETLVRIANPTNFVTPMAITIDGGTLISEIVICNSHVLSTFTCIRASRPFSHLQGAKVNGFVVAYQTNQANAEIKAIEAALGANLVNIIHPVQTSTTQGTITPSPDGTTTAFTISGSVTSVSAVNLNGLLLILGIDYTVASSVITLTVAPILGDVLSAQVFQ